MVRVPAVHFVLVLKKKKSFNSKIKMHAVWFGQDDSNLMKFNLDQFLDNQITFVNNSIKYYGD